VCSQAVVADLENKLRAKEAEWTRLKKEAHKLDFNADPALGPLGHTGRARSANAGATAERQRAARQEKMAALRAKLEQGGSLVEDAMVQFVSGGCPPSRPPPSPLLTSPAAAAAPLHRRRPRCPAAAPARPPPLQATWQSWRSAR
jgi:hypothetical protein